MKLSKIVFAQIIFAAVLASADTSKTNYVCIGLDEAPGYAIVNATPDPEQSLKPFGHVNGAEVRLLEADDSVSLTVKSSDKKIMTVVAAKGKILFSQLNPEQPDQAMNISCVAQ